MNKGVPEKFSGDLQKFRLSLCIVSEFAMKYCVEGQIDISMNFDGFTNEQKFSIAFEFVFTKNIKFSDKTLLNLMNNFPRDTNQVD